MNFYYDWNALNQNQYGQSANSGNNGAVTTSNQPSNRNSYPNPYDYIPTENLNSSPYLNWANFNRESQQKTQQQTQRLSLQTPISIHRHNQAPSQPPPPPQTPCVASTPISFNQSQLWNEQGLGPSSTPNPAQDQQSFYSSGKSANRNIL